jgi:hypothetical protein
LAQDFLFRIYNMPEIDEFKFGSLPAILPIPLRITSQYGVRKHPLSGESSEHKGLDIGARSGTPALAVFDGVVIRRGLRSENYNTGCGEGILIGHKTNPNTPGRITHTTSYCHLLEGSTAIGSLEVGKDVRAGQFVGRVGTTGGSTAPHLHFELRRVIGDPDVNPDGILQFTDTPIDPTPYIRDYERPATDFLNAQVAGYRANLPGIDPRIESLESFHPNIQYELTRRRVSAETANTYMPFVKLTSLTKVLPDNLPDGQTSAYCPSLGIHDRDNITFDDIYLPKSNKSTIGYARAGNKGETPVPVVVSNSTRDAANIPIPGITQFTVERSTAGPMGVRGGLVKVDLKIVAYSIGQVDALLRYYLRPGTRAVLEVGRTSANQKEKPITPFNWKQSESDISTYFSELIKSPQLQNDFIKEYIYKNNGNYEAFITYVVKFNLKYNKNNTFEIDLTLHSVQQFEVTTKHTAVQSTCPSPTKACDVMDIQEYFSDTHSWKDNSFKRLVSHYENDTLSSAELFWKFQIIPIKKTNSTPNTADGPSTSADTRENEYFVTWNFFVEKILNDNQYGIASMLGNAEVANLALLRVTEEPNESTDEGLIANQVGYHPNLRSTNADVMIIWNETAQTRFEQTTDFSRYDSIKNLAARDSDLKIVEDIKKSLESSDIETALKSATEPFSRVSDNGKAGASYLSRGIWLNTKAIKQVFTSTDTISAAISMLLNMMNSVTEGYWNLQLYSTDVKSPGMHIIDMGLSKEPKLLSKPSLGIDREEAETNNILNSITGITPARYRGDNEDEPKYIYMFNRGTKLFNDGELGSELIDLNVEFNLPQVIAVQAIANIGGPAQKPLLSSINVEELQKISLIKGLYTSCDDSADDAICESDLVGELNRAVEIARQAEADVVAAEQRAPRVTDAQLFVSDRRLAEAQSNRETAELRLAAAQVDQYNPNLVGTVREYADLGTAIKMIEINPSRMMKELNIDSVSGTITPRSTTHAFNSSNLTKTVIDITLPGIGGIGLFQSFLVDRIPSIITRGFYVVTKVVHEFSTQNGWITKIQGRFRFRPEGAEDAPVITTSSGATVPFVPAQAASNFRRAPVTPLLGGGARTFGQFLDNNNPRDR